MQVFGNLVEITICLATAPVEADKIIKDTFNYVDLPGYHMIFGHTCLEEIHVVLDIGPQHTLQHTTPAGQKYCMPIVSKDIVCTSPIYREACICIQNNPNPLPLTKMVVSTLPSPK